MTLPGTDGRALINGPTKQLQIHMPNWRASDRAFGEVTGLTCFSSELNPGDSGRCLFREQFAEFVREFGVLSASVRSRELFLK